MQLDYDFRRLRGDVFGGITATIVIFPAAIAFGLASGLGAAAGIYGSIAVGFFAAVFGGTRTQISGATGPMAVAMAVIVTTHASTIAEALTVVLLGGAFQIVLGLTKVGRFVAYTPKVVISGFMSGIGAIIILLQLLPLLGAPSAGGPMESFKALPEAFSNIDPSALTIGAISLVLAAFWPKKLTSYVPGAIVAVVVGTLFGVLWLSDAPVIGPVSLGLPSFQLHLPDTAFLLRSLEPALVLALLGSIDSLLTSLIADSVTGTRHKPNRELVGQGIGNMFAGMFGGMPGAGNTLGTLSNIRAGGTTRASGVTYAIVMFILVVGLARYIEPIPLAVLAGVLIKIGIDIIDWRIISRAHKLHPGMLIVMLTTFGVTVFVDLVTAVTFGLIVAAMAHSRRLERLELENIISTPLLDSEFLGIENDIDPFLAQVGLLRFRGTFTVASSHLLLGSYSLDVRAHEIVLFDFSETNYVDDSASFVIEQLVDATRENDTELIIVGVQGPVLRTFTALDILHDVSEARIVDTMAEAQQLSKDLLGVSTRSADLVD